MNPGVQELEKIRGEGGTLKPETGGDGTTCAAERGGGGVDGSIQGGTGGEETRNEETRTQTAGRLNLE